ncbi:MAG: endolytic transglycosylase MltG, partial [Methylophilaceae bacterium]|nr:endolytic transglycosylase MltG [Methylophilaceae bacterium]
MKRLLITAVAATVLGLLIFLIYLDHYAKSPLLLADATQTFSVKPKSGLTSVANQLVNQGVIESALPFVLLARSLNKGSSLQAGDYTLEQGITPLALLTALSKGKRMQAKITFIEGKTFKDMRTKLTSHSAIHHTIVKASEAEIMALIGVKQNHLEGLFFPDTYYFDQGTDDIVILKRAYQTMLEKLET